MFSSYDTEWIYAELDGMVELGFNTLPAAEQHGSLTGRNEAVDGPETDSAGHGSHPAG